jgi:serine/threonine protein kinase
MELCQGGELFDRVVEKDHYSEKEAARAVIAVARALQHCHHHDIVHRDLKPENLLYFEPPPSLETLKLADFGLAHLLEPGASLRTACGTPGYVAPEIVKNLPYNSAVDMWSLGIVLYILLCGFPPFYDDNTAVLFDTIARGVYEFTPPYWDAVSDEAKAVVSKLMCADPKKRLTADQLLAEPWVKGEGTPDTALPGFQEQLGKYNAKRKFKNVIMQGQIVNFLQKSAKVTNALAAKVAKAKAAAAETAAAA